MSELQESLNRIEAEVRKKPSVSPWITSVLVPLIIAAVTATLSVLSVSSGGRANQLKQVEVLHTVINDFSREHPERTLLLLEVVKVALSEDRSVASKLEAYALSLTKEDAKKASDAGGEAGAERLDEILAALRSTDTPAAKSVATQISGEKYHVIAASDTPMEGAKVFKAQLLAEGFPNAEIFATSKRFAVSLGEFDYASAKEAQKRFQALERFTPKYPNVAYLEKKRSTWLLVK